MKAKALVNAAILAILVLILLPQDSPEQQRRMRRSSLKATLVKEAAEIDAPDENSKAVLLSLMKQSSFREQIQQIDGKAFTAEELYSMTNKIAEKRKQKSEQEADWDRKFGSEANRAR